MRLREPEVPWLASRTARPMKWLRWLAAPSLLLLNLWCAAALYYAPIGPNLVTTVSAALFLCTVLAIGWRISRPALRWACLTTVWTSVLFWFLLVPAPSQADWLPESKVAPQVEIVGDQVTVRGLRDFEWRGASDFDERWVARSYPLSGLRSVDFFLSFWGAKKICHTFVSFAFERPDKSLDYVTISIEVRKHRGQSYSALGSAFRQFTLIYIWSSETDVIRVRTNFRREEVYRYRLRIEPSLVKHFFLRYVEETQQLYAHPRWYNAVTENCGVDILRTVWGRQMGFFPSKQQLFNGLWEQQAYDDGRLDRSLPFEQLRARANISQEAQQATPVNFSQAIRRTTVWLNVRRQPTR